MKDTVQNVECGVKAFPEGVQPAEAKAREPKSLRVVFRLTQGTHYFLLSSNGSSPASWGKQS